MGCKAYDSEGNTNETMLEYDFFGRLASKTEYTEKREIHYCYDYTKSDKRKSMIMDYSNGFIMEEKRSYDSFGRLTTIDSGSQKLSYEYNMRVRVIKQRANGVDIVFSYDKLGRLKTKVLGSEKMPISKIEYFYGANSQITAREVNGAKQEYKYDELGQLLSVAAGEHIL